MTAARSSVDRAKLRPPPLQTNYLHQSHNEDSPISPRPQSPYDQDRQPEVQERPATKGGHQPFVLTDPVAFRYLEEDASTQVLERRRELRGYECYIVEQWTTSRVHPTFMITNYTGDDKDIVVVDVLSVPTDEHAWSPRLRVYFKALNQYHARRRETPLGVLMVTNLSGFPSSLAIIPVPDGDVRRHRFDFFVNEDLKRLGCSGRVGLTLAQPAASTVAKFHQLYRTSDKNDIYKSVLELIKLCQSALMLFDKLEIDYSDGLLCDVTERAINDWWVEIGSDHYNVEPHDGILGPTTVAGLLGLLMGARNRLHAINAPVSKDPFDVEAMKQGISAFQKQQRIQRTRRLDRRTLDRLHKATQKVAEKERWAVPKAVKSTVAELSGRGGEMIGDIVGRRDRASIAEVETVDIDRFVQLGYGDRAKWLWLGKPMKKSKVPDGAERVPEEVQGAPALNKGLIFKPDEHGGYTWTSGRKSTFDGLPPGERREQERDYRDFITPTPVEENDEFEDDYVGRPSLEVNRPSMFHRATTLKDKPKAGLDKVKGAVGFRGHKPKPSVDEPVPRSPVEQKASRRPLIRRSHTSPLSSPSSPELSSGQHMQRLTPAAEEQSNRLNVALGDSRPDTADTRSLIEGSNSRLVSQESFQASGYSSLQKENSNVSSNQQQRSASKESTGPSVEASVAGSIYKGIDLNDTLPTGPETEAGLSTLLKRTISYSQYVEAELQGDHGGLAPRHLSFSLAEESLLTWERLGQDEYDPFSSARAQLAEQHYMAAESKHLRRMINALQYQTATWTSKELHQLREILERLDQDQDTLDELHQPHLRTVKELQTHAGAIQREEKERLEEGVKEIETLAAKLEYEVGGLRGKVEDVEAGVTDFEKSVGRVEGRVVELEKEAENGSKCVIQ
ncbi:Protein STB2 [Pseudocercospora fuligena]|uniref:Protein STB2 n=1 Tax=Pseudocercospora fuligena TaxID=685502 RepID=A0A8H6VHU0_9PEZI|nr:Protein STB2 [Pseudocercospora fuligena]